MNNNNNNPKNRERFCSINLIFTSKLNSMPNTNFPNDNCKKKERMLNSKQQWFWWVSHHPSPTTTLCIVV
jgi:hypothetical protein